MYFESLACPWNGRLRVKIEDLYQNCCIPQVYWNISVKPAFFLSSSRSSCWRMSSFHSFSHSSVAMGSPEYGPSESQFRSRHSSGGCCHFPTLRPRSDTHVRSSDRSQSRVRPPEQRLRPFARVGYSKKRNPNLK